MTVQVRIDGRTHTVVVERVPSAPDRYKVSWGGQSRLVDARRIDSMTLSLILLDREAASHEVRCLEDGSSGDLMLYLRDGIVRATLGGGRSRFRSTTEAVGAGEQRIVAPMPGKVVRVLVQPGDEVASRQALVVVEAMKMQNELTSPKAGRVKQVVVEEGMSVEAGRLLVVVE
jgi:acetyl/propionyl-CoA carboxylase alpha subunit